MDAVVLGRIELILVEGLELAARGAPGVADESVQASGRFLHEEFRAIGEAAAIAEQLRVLETRHIRQAWIQFEQVVHRPVKAFDFDIVPLHRITLDTEHELIAPRRSHPFIGGKPHIKAGKRLIRDECEELGVAAVGGLKTK